MDSSERNRLIRDAEEIQKIQHKMIRDISEIERRVQGILRKAPDLNINREIRYLRDIQARIRDLRISRKIKNELT